LGLILKSFFPLSYFYSKSIIPLLMALFCIIVWGVSYAVTRSAVQQIPPLTLACLRFYFIPLVGVVSGIVLLNEPVTAKLFYGGGLIFCGVFLARFR
jgi:drug/metabolite transporter (DMT)-like permease